MSVELRADAVCDEVGAGVYIGWLRKDVQH